MTGAPVLIREDADIDFEWGSDSPGEGVPADDFSVRWSRHVWLDEATYDFSVFADDGVRLWVDGQLLVDQWWESQGNGYDGTVALASGYHYVLMEYYDHLGSATARLSWEEVG